MAAKEVGDIFPVIEKSYEHWRVINMQFLPGSSYFWEHMKEHHPKIYESLIKEMTEQLAKPIVPSTMSQELDGVEFRIEISHSPYHILAKVNPGVLDLIPGSSQYANDAERLLHAVFNYEKLVRYPSDRKRFILYEKFDFLHNKK